jgi:hypothetical protein
VMRVGFDSLRASLPNVEEAAAVEAIGD